MPGNLGGRPHNKCAAAKRFRGGGRADPSANCRHTTAAITGRLDPGTGILWNSAEHDSVVKRLFCGFHPREATYEHCYNRQYSRRRDTGAQI